MNVLSKAGLGKKKMVFFKDDNHQQFVENINKAYPRLVQCEGFTLQSASARGYGCPLTSFNTQWFHVKFEKEEGYIKPMQQNLSLDSVTEERFCYLNILCIILRRVWL